MSEISVILPFYNREDTLGAAIDSVLKQTFREFELILVDDGSTDGSAAVAQSFQDDRIRLLAPDVNSGVCRARNIGLEASDTPLLAFMDSDDVWLPAKLETQVRNLQALQASGGNVSVLGCGWRLLGADSPSREFSAGPFTRADVMMNRVAGLGTPMLLVDTRRAAPGAKFDPELPALVDRDYVLSCLGNSSSVAVVPEVLAEVRRGRDDHVANPARAVEALEVMIEKYAAELELIPGGASWYHFRAARECMVLGQRGRAGRHIRPALQAKGVARAFHLLLGALVGKSGLAVAQRIIRAE